MVDAILSQLIAMSRNLGDPAMDYAILGEGNTSARIDAETFWVKASGAPLRTLDRNGLVRVYFDPILELLENERLSDADIRKGLESARVDLEAQAILCSKRAAEAISGRLFPDEIVYCGPAPAYVLYTDPGPPLARAVRQAIVEYSEIWGQAPKVILMQNHGFIAMGKSPADVENIT